MGRWCVNEAYILTFNIFKRVSILRVSLLNARLKWTRAEEKLSLFFKLFPLSLFSFLLALFVHVFVDLVKDAHTHT